MGQVYGDKHKPSTDHYNVTGIVRIRFQDYNKDSTKQAAIVSL